MLKNTQTDPNQTSQPETTDRHKTTTNMTPSLSLPLSLHFAHLHRIPRAGEPKGRHDPREPVEEKAGVGVGSTDYGTRRSERRKQKHAHHDPNGRPSHMQNSKTQKRAIDPLIMVPMAAIPTCKLQDTIMSDKPAHHSPKAAIATPTPTPTLPNNQKARQEPRNAQRTPNKKQNQRQRPPFHPRSFRAAPMDLAPLIFPPSSTGSRR